ncbi:DNA cytosine methyltransferase [Patescibacteria group bacterium]|nr:DNA cytosine methyltransferase [Patescibacteria group bacterium]MCG2694814.1 DNA cytosine methyltransferase [Candidatus Parcubacteria bacterium]
MSSKNKKTKLTFIDLFAGIGGFHLAFHENDARCVFASEWNEYARKTYEENFKKISPDIFENDNFAGDITKVKIKNIPNFDIVCGGFPCQPFSQAGFKKGFRDERGNLFFQVAKIIKTKKPKAFFLENVRHLFSHDDGKTFATIKKIIEEDLGYSFYYKIVKGTDFNIPQHRPRLFMVGFRNKKIQFKFPEPVKLEKTMKDIFGAPCEKKIGYTLRVGGRGSVITDRRNWDSYRVKGKVVRLGVKEGKKMMGLPSDYVFPVSDAQAMKQLGNAVVVPAVSAVAKEIINTLNKHYAN